MTKSPRKNVPDVGIELVTACMPSEHTSDRATTPGNLMVVAVCYIKDKRDGSSHRMLWKLLFVTLKTKVMVLLNAYNGSSCLLH